MKRCFFCESKEIVGEPQLFQCISCGKNYDNYLCIKCDKIFWQENDIGSEGIKKLWSKHFETCCPPIDVI